MDPFSWLGIAAVAVSMSNAHPTVIYSHGGDPRVFTETVEGYRRSGQQVRLRLCNSACTLFLTLPYNQVCVYANGSMMFHAAYNPITKETNAEWTYRLMQSYPYPLQQRLGVLTSKKQFLSGTELSRYGVRLCKK
jgi:hypothetical protein